MAKQAAFAVETKVTEWINDIIRFIGEVILQVALYGTLLAKKCFMDILGAFGPLMFALSLAPPWKSAWSQWLSKYISLSLWGFVAYTILYYTEFILLYYAEQDVAAYEGLISSGGVDNSWEQVGMLGLQGIGTTCMYVVGLLMGAYLLKYTSEVASWLIPGGVSSGVSQQTEVLQWERHRWQADMLWEQRRRQELSPGMSLIQPDMRSHRG